MGLQLSCVRKLSKAGDESSTGLLLLIFWCSGSRSLGSLSTQLSHQEQSGVDGAISVSTAQYNEIIWDFQWTSECQNMIVGAVLLAYKSNPTAGAAALPWYLPNICIVSAVKNGAVVSSKGRENKASRNTPAYILLFSISFWRAVFFLLKGSAGGQLVLLRLITLPLSCSAVPPSLLPNKGWAVL